jgi:hypothetical protein
LVSSASVAASTPPAALVEAAVAATGGGNFVRERDGRDPVRQRVTDATASTVSLSSSSESVKSYL